MFNHEAASLSVDPSQSQLVRLKECFVAERTQWNAATARAFYGDPTVTSAILDGSVATSGTIALLSLFWRNSPEDSLSKKKDISDNRQAILTTSYQYIERQLTLVLPQRRQSCLPHVKLLDAHPRNLFAIGTYEPGLFTSCPLIPNLYDNIMTIFDNNLGIHISSGVRYDTYRPETGSLHL